MSGEYLVIAAALEEEIRNGALAPLTRLPAERALCARWGVSRGTVQRAIALLMDRNLLERRQGSGTFVTGGAVNDGATSSMLRRELQRLYDLQFSAAELDALFFSEVWGRLKEEERIRCTFVSDMPELLAAETSEIAAKSGLLVSGWMIGEAARRPTLFEENPILAARDSCYPALKGVEATRPIAGAFEEVVFTLSVDTIRALVSLEGSYSIAAAYTSQAYLKMLRRILAEFCPGVNLHPYRLQEWQQAASRPHEPCLLMPPMEAAVSKRWTAGWGGRVILFTPSLDRGSSVRLMERGRRVWENAKV